MHFNERDFHMTTSSFISLYQIPQAIPMPELADQFVTSFNQDINHSLSVIDWLRGLSIGHLSSMITPYQTGVILMPMDGSVIAAVRSELEPYVIAGRIDKIYQPENDELIFSIRYQRNNIKMLVSADNQYPRIQLTPSVKQNPAQPPVFCMLLRKHLSGGRIVEIEQPSFERILVMHVHGTDELNQPTHKKLVVEMMGKHSNIILVDADTNLIIDSIKRIPLHISRKRQVLPGLPYELPPSEKNDPLKIIDLAAFDQILSETHQNSVSQALMNAFNGISPHLANEICHRSRIEPDHQWTMLIEEEKRGLFDHFQQIIQQIKQPDFYPQIYYHPETGQYLDFSVILLTHLSSVGIRPFESTSGMLEDFYGQKDRQNRLQQRSQDLRKNLTIKRNRLSHKLQNLFEDEDKAKKSVQDKIKADLIMANLHDIKIGQSELEAVNFYDESLALIRISLDKRKTPVQNAQKFYKRYHKSKTALTEIKKQRNKTLLELKYLDQIILSVEQSETLGELDMIRQELEDAGYVRKKPVKKNQSQASKSQPLSFSSSENNVIRVGKNNLQNEEVTFRIAKKNDLWFHVKDMPGSHVVLLSGSSEPTESEILEAATLAAYYSKARQSSNVPVDYTTCRHVRKQRGARPGMVLYENFQTVYVTPVDDKLQMLQNQNNS
jgi:predicted ribosome quality control (RQC) complex YloA/Tae2 family protein